MTLREGCHFERRMFHSTFATVRQRGFLARLSHAAHARGPQNDQKEGMKAFMEKRAPQWSDS